MVEAAPLTRSLKPTLLRIAIAMLFFGVLSEFVILSQLYRVSTGQAAIVAKQERELAMRRARVRIPPGGKLVEESNGRFTAVSPPKTIAPGVSVTESVSHHNIYNDGRDVLEHGELETTRLTLTPIAIAVAIPTTAGLILTLILSRSSGASTIPPTESASLP